MKTFFRLICLPMLIACSGDPGPVVKCSAQQLSLFPLSKLETQNIVVCFDEEVSIDERNIIKGHVDTSWGEAFRDPNVPENDWIQFVYWGECDDVEDYDILVTTGDDISAYASFYSDGTLEKVHIGFGYYIDTSFRIRRYVMHEFGHALGFMHEHERHDHGDQRCFDGYPVDSENTANVYYGEYDRFSVMAYCGNIENLSDGDIKWTRYIYYSDYYQKVGNCIIK